MGAVEATSAWQLGFETAFVPRRVHEAGPVRRGDVDAFAAGYARAVHWLTGAGVSIPFNVKQSRDDRRRWPPVEIAVLRALWPDRTVRLDIVAACLGVSIQAAKNRAHRLGLGPRRPRPVDETSSGRAA